MVNIVENIQNKQDWQTISIDGRLGKKLYVHDYDKEKLTTILISDEHTGSKFSDQDTLDRNLDWCLENDCPIIHLGDMCETATKDSVGAGVHEQDVEVQRQIERSIQRYKPLADEGLLLGLHIGNHEARVYNHSGTNITRLMAQMLGVPYLGVGAVHYFRVGRERYTLYTTHGNSGARLPHTKIANAIKLSNMIDCEAYAQGHLHQLSHHVQNYYTINKSKRRIEESQKHYILTGSYLKHWGSYAHTSNMEPARIGSPKVKLSGLEHRIRVSF